MLQLWKYDALLEMTEYATGKTGKDLKGEYEGKVGGPEFKNRIPRGHFAGASEADNLL